MDIKEVLTRIGFVRNSANLSARRMSEKIDMSPQYISQIESGRITLSVKKLLEILEVCNFPVERFFSADISDYNTDIELLNLIQSLPPEKKKNIIDFLKK